LAAEAKFLTGSTLGHVIRMTMTGATGITFVFIVDAANLFWISQLGDPALVAAIGYAFAIQFFSVSIGVGMMIAATAMVSRQIGQGNTSLSRQTATASMILAALVQALVAAIVIYWRRELLGLAGASGETLALAARYLALSLPSLPIMALGLIASAALRAAGDGKRAMFVTLSSGGVAVLMDPVLIFWLELGLDGAAASLFLFRIILALVALRFAIGTHDLLARPSMAAFLATLAPFTWIAAPAIATQMATPFGNFVVTSVISEFGDDAVAGWAVVNRLTVVAFGGVFALAGAIGGIFGQNFGAGQLDRVRSTYRDALLFVLLYCTLAWAILFAATQPVAQAFGLRGAGYDVLVAYTQIGAGAFIFTGTLFVASAAFNTLGRPGRATLMSWLRDGVLIWPVATWMAGVWAAQGVIYAQALVGAIAGVLAAWWGWTFVRTLSPLAPETLDLTTRRGYRDPNRYRRR